MNIENNKRFTDTEEKIVKAYQTLLLSKEIHKITVRDICEKAQIHRTTFYHHFEDIPDLHRRADRLYLKKIFDNFVIDGRWNFYDGIMKQILFLYNHRSVISRNILTSEGRVHLEHFISNSLFEDYTDSYMEKYHCDSMTEFLYHREFFSSGFTALILKWMEGGCKESPESIGTYICKIYNLEGPAVSVSTES